MTRCDDLTMDASTTSPKSSSESPEAMDVHAVLGEQRWSLKLVLLAVWVVASFGACYFARDLEFMVAGWPFGYWMAAQGAVLVFLAIVVVHAWAMNRHERAVAQRLSSEARQDG